MKEDRFLIGILIAVVLLIAGTALLLFTRQGKEVYRSGDQPQDVVHNYVVALIKQDYEKAYGYLADQDYKPTLEEFSNNFKNTYSDPLDETALSVGEEHILGSKASVEIDLLSKGYSTFNSYSHSQAELIYQDGAWKLVDGGTYGLWDYQWFMEPYPEPY